MFSPFVVLRYKKLNRNLDEVQMRYKNIHNIAEKPNNKE